MTLEKKERLVLRIVHKRDKSSGLALITLPELVSVAGGKITVVKVVI